MRHNYSEVLEVNFRDNEQQKHDRMQRMEGELQGQDNIADSLEREIERQDSCLDQFFGQRMDRFLLRRCMNVWMKDHKVKRQKNRIAAFTRNTMHRRKMSQLFREWRDVSHKWFIAKLDVDMKQFEI